MNKDEQKLKCQNDQDIVRFSTAPESGDKFKINPESKSSWVKPGAEFTTSELRARIEPWLTALFQSEHLSLLAGSGLTNAVHNISECKASPGMNKAEFSIFSDEINADAEKTAKSSGRGIGNIEDQIRTAKELLRGLRILAGKEKKYEKNAKSLEDDLDKVIAAFANSILQGELQIIGAEKEKRESAFNYLVSFLMSFASRSGTRDRLNVFTTNYDRVIEAGAELAGLHLLDRFVGSLAPMLRASRLDVDMHYNPPGIRGEPRYLEGVAKFTKLHGSVDWVDTSGSIRRIGLPFGAADTTPYLSAPGLSGAKALDLMVYPNSAKDRETAGYPYVELFRDFAAAVCRPNSTLVTYGYSFGDEHINRVIEDMLVIPSTHLVIISFGDTLGRIEALYKKVGRPAQITMMIGSHLGNLRELVDNYLPKPAIDRTTFRMSELLKSRWNMNDSKEKKPAQGAPDKAEV